MEELHFVKADPSGNTTIFVLDPIPKEEQSVLAQELMKKESVCAEQVAFIDEEPPRCCDMAIRMMGGEFCGNAVRAAAAWKVFDRERWQPSQQYVREKSFQISCSGINHNVCCKVNQTGPTSFDVKAEMPRPVSILAMEDDSYRIWEVCLPRITHYCIHLVEPLLPEEKEQLVAVLLKAHSVKSGEAAGILFWDGQFLEPFVYVRETDTLINESSCGSGTAAIAASLAMQRRESVHVEAKQPGGTIYGEAMFDQGDVVSVCIGGPIRITEEGIVYV